MSKAIQGAAMLAGAVGMGAAAFLDPALVASPFFDKIMASLVIGGISMEAGAIAGALTQNRGMGITTRQPASLRQIVYGEQRVGGVEIYRSTTGSHHDQFNFIIVIAGHEIDSIVNLYLDGRQVYWLGSGNGWSVRNGVGFGGVADNNTHIGPGGQHYNFGGTGHSGIYCEARYGDQMEGDVISALTANDPNWAASGGNSPWVAGCAYIYLKVEYNPSLFPSEPAIRLTVRGKNDIYDPRTLTKGFTNNWALIINDVLTDPTFGLGDVRGVNRAQLIAAANVCDEQVPLSIGGTESRYCCDWHYDTGTSPGDVLQTMMPAAAGRLSRIGGEWYIWPAYWQGPSFTFEENILTGEIEWIPYRGLRELINRVNGTYIAPNSPWNVAGNLYDANGWYNGTIANQFPFAFTPTNYPQYAHDVLHGYAEDIFLEADSGVLGPWASGTSYNLDDAVVFSAPTSPVGPPIIYRSLSQGNIGNQPDTHSAPYVGASTAWSISATFASGDACTYQGDVYISLVDANTGNQPDISPSAWQLFQCWIAWSNQLPLELVQNCVLSIAQAQRCAKITIMRNRQQGSGTFPMALKAWQMQPLDVMQLAFSAYGWGGKQLEISATTFHIEPPQEEGGAPSVRFTASAQETDQTSYEWSTTEELSVYDVPGNPTVSPYTVDPPSDLVLLSDATTAVIGADGVNTPRILAAWVPSPDVLVTQTQIQYQNASSPLGPWIDVGTVDTATTSAYISGVVSGDYYNVQIRALRANGATSVWVEAGPVLVGAPNSLQNSYSNNPAISLSQPDATTITMQQVSVTFGGNTVQYAGRDITIPAPAAPTWYYITINDPTQSGESGSPISATLTANASIDTNLCGVLGQTYMGAILALPGGAAISELAGGWPAPTTFQVGP
jgi:hypothetical protein